MFHIFFNKKTNQGIAMPHLSDIQYYNPDSMTTDPTRASNRKSFLEWDDGHRNDTFDLNTELLKYLSFGWRHSSTILLEIQRSVHGNYIR